MERAARKTVRADFCSTVQGSNSSRAGAGGMEKGEKREMGNKEECVGLTTMVAGKVANK